MLWPRHIATCAWYFRRGAPVVCHLLPGDLAAGQDHIGLVPGKKPCGAPSDFHHLTPNDTVEFDPVANSVRGFEPYRDTGENVPYHVAQSNADNREQYAVPCDGSAHRLAHHQHDGCHQRHEEQSRHDHFPHQSWSSALVGRGTLKGDSNQASAQPCRTK